jgi:hypothetical protein
MSLESELSKVNDYRARDIPRYTELTQPILQKRKLGKTKTVTAIGAILALFGCEHSTTPPIEDTYVDIKIRAPEKLEYTEVLSRGGGPVINHVLNQVPNPSMRIEGNGKSIDNVVPGQEVNLGSVKKNTRVDYTTTVTGDSGNVFRSVVHESLTATGNVLVLPKFEVFDQRTINTYTIFHWLLLEQNTNFRWAHVETGQTYGVLDLSFNPDDQGTGARLSDSYIIPTEDFLELFASHTKGKMVFNKAINSNRNGNYAPGEPADGQFRTFYTSQSNIGVANGVYPVNGDRTLKEVMVVNPEHAMAGELFGEIVDALNQGNQNVSFDPYPARFQLFSINGLTFKLKINKGRVESYNEVRYVQFNKRVEQINKMLGNDPELMQVIYKNAANGQTIASALMLPSEDLWAAIEATYSRPAGNDQGYKFYIDHEERTSWPTSTTSVASTTTGTQSTSNGGYSSPTITGGSVASGNERRASADDKRGQEQKRNLNERIKN